MKLCKWIKKWYANYIWWKLWCMIKGMWKETKERSDIEDINIVKRFLYLSLLYKELHCIIVCLGSGIILHTFCNCIYQLPIGLEQLLIGLRLLTGSSPLTRIETLYVLHRHLTQSISLTKFFCSVDHFLVTIPTSFSLGEGFPS